MASAKCGLPFNLAASNALSATLNRAVGRHATTGSAFMRSGSWGGTIVHHCHTWRTEVRTSIGVQIPLGYCGLDSRPVQRKLDHVCIFRLFCSPSLVHKKNDCQKRKDLQTRFCTQKNTHLKRSSGTRSSRSRSQRRSPRAGAHKTCRSRASGLPRDTYHSNSNALTPHSITQCARSPLKAEWKYEPFNK